MVLNLNLKLRRRSCIANTFLYWRDHVCTLRRPATLDEEQCYFCEEPYEFNFVSLEAFRPSTTVIDSPIYQIQREHYPLLVLEPPQDRPLCDSEFIRRPIIRDFVRVPYSPEFCRGLVRLQDIEEAAETTMGPIQSMAVTNVLVHSGFVIC